MDKKFFDCMKQEVFVGDQIAASTMAYKGAHIRVGKVTKMNPETGIVSILLDDGTYSKIHGTRGALVLNRGRATRTTHD